MSRARVAIVVPVLNEGTGIERFVSRVTAVMETLHANWSVLFVDDGSTDNTLSAIRIANAADARITAISLSRNFGKETAIAAGLRNVDADAAIVMDGDLQHPPETIPAFLEAWRDGNLIVFGQRMQSAANGAIRKFYSNLFYRVFGAISQVRLPPGTTDFLLLDRKAVEALNRLDERTRFSKGLYSWIGFRSATVPFHCAERVEGHSKWRLRKLAIFAIDGFAAFSSVPLKIWSYVGALVSAISLGYALYFFVRTMIMGVDVPGFPSLIVSITVFAGVQLISLGIIGEYLARVYEEVKGRPLFFVAERIGTANPPAREAAANPRRVPRAVAE